VESVHRDEAGKLHLALRERKEKLAVSRPLRTLVQGDVNLA
jgi:hypothetical protein